jgi:hypothetical protein
VGDGRKSSNDVFLILFVFTGSERGNENTYKMAPPWHIRLNSFFK